MTFIIGQRWISNTESQLGLGIITDISGRQVSISFPAAGEERTYASDNAPLSRIIYKEGEKITTVEQDVLKVTNVEEHQGLLCYTGVDEDGTIIQIGELALDCFIKITTPQQRLFTDQIDKLRSYKLRIDTLHHLGRLQQSKVKGLLGSRTSHLAHQVYIANEVAERYAPRVLLADEVGLGKTIEAGMILHHQLHSGRANRVLIVVPDTLIHQWLVEMMRRFNLYFSIFDQSRYEILNEEEGEESTQVDENLFETEQLVLCSLDFLMKNDEARRQATASTWDLLVVDEAHHLHWSKESVSPEYQCIEELSTQSKGLLLLTATPEQVGIQSHFARLRLIDPSRFYNLDVFKTEEANYQAVNKLVQQLIAHRETSPTEELSLELKTQLKDFFPEENQPTHVNEIIKHLLDRHGTGRVLFRNTRLAIPGFPERHLHHYPLSETNGSDGDEWLESDRRIQWLITQIKELHPEKILVICAQAITAIVLEQHIKLKTGIRSASFHERLSIIERDRAAAYFSEQENGAQVLFCSEIGSEGRNFQFAHHLVLFDLPLNPDLLEQRIGRLDRIGQRHSVEIHVPYIVNTDQEKLFRWYHEGINLFEKSCSVGFSIYEKFESRLLEILELPPTEKNQALFDELLKDTQSYTQQVNLALSEGRDRLLEMNSCNHPEAEELIAGIETEENSLELESYMTRVFHEYGVEQEYHSENAEILSASNHMKTSHFPGLKEDGMTVTYSRPKALVREDMEFLSWEHPMVCGAMEMILGSELGNATLATISVKGLPPGTLFLETFYTINCAAPKYLQIDTFLPLIPLRVFIDVTGKNFSKLLDYSKLNGMCEPIKRHTSQAIIKQVRTDIEAMLEQSHALAEEQMIGLIEQAKSQLNIKLGEEVKRLEDLQKVNPSIRQEEIDFLKNQIADSESFIERGSLKLQALRVIINK